MDNETRDGGDDMAISIQVEVADIEMDVLDLDGYFGFRVTVPLVEGSTDADEMGRLADAAARKRGLGLRVSALVDGKSGRVAARAFSAFGLDDESEAERALDEIGAAFMARLDDRRN